MEQMELNKYEHCQYPCNVGHPIEKVSILMVEQVHIDINQLHLQNDEEVGFLSRDVV